MYFSFALRAGKTVNNGLKVGLSIWKKTLSFHVPKNVKWKAIDELTFCIGEIVQMILKDSESELYQKL